MLSHEGAVASPQVSCDWTHHSAQTGLLKERSRYTHSPQKNETPQLTRYHQTMCNIHVLKSEMDNELSMWILCPHFERQERVISMECKYSGAVVSSFCMSTRTDLHSIQNGQGLNRTYRLHKYSSFASSNISVRHACRWVSSLTLHWNRSPANTMYWHYNMYCAYSQLFTQYCNHGK